MKKSLFITLIFLGGLCRGYAQDITLFYYHNNDKIYLNKIENTKVIHFNKTIEASQKDSILNRLIKGYGFIAEINPFIYIVSDDADYFEENSIISKAVEIGDITYISDMLNKNSDMLWGPMK